MEFGHGGHAENGKVSWSGGREARRVARFRVGADVIDAIGDATGASSGTMGQVIGAPIRCSRWPRGMRICLPNRSAHNPSAPLVAR